MVPTAIWPWRTLALLRVREHENMRSLDPHVSVIVDNANEAAQFPAVLWGVNLENGLDLVG